MRKKLKKLYLFLSLSLLLVCCVVLPNFYVKAENSTNEVFNPVLGVKNIEKNINYPEEQKSGNGIYISARDDSKSIIIESNNVYTTNLLSKDIDLLNFQVVSQDDKSLLESIKIDLVDADDDNNMVSAFIINAVKDDGSYYNTSYVRGEYGSLSKGRCNEVGKEGQIWSNFYGTTLYSTSFATCIYDNLEQFNIKFDYSTKQLLTREFLVMDFDDPLYVNNLIFDGFSNNTFKVRITLNYKNRSSGGIIISKFLGFDLSGDFVFNNKKVKELWLDLDSDFTYGAPNGVVNYKYKVPCGYSSDLLSGKLDIETKVYFIDNENEIDVSNNLKNSLFFPENVGKYKIKYTAKNKYDNIVSNEIIFEVVKDLPQYYITFDTSLKNPTINEFYYLPSFSVKGGVGDIKVNRTIYYNNDIVVPDGHDRIFIDKSGYLIMTISVSGFFDDSYSKSFLLLIDDTNMDIVLDESISPSIKRNEDYILPSFDVSGISNKSNLIKKIFVDGEEIDINNRIIKTEKSIDESVQVEYFASINGKELSKTYDLQIVDINNLTEFINATNGKVTSEVDGVHVCGNKDFSFSTPFYVSGVDLGVKFSVIQNNFQKINIDLSNELNKTTLSIYKISDNTSKLIIDNDKETIIKGSLINKDNIIELVVNVKNGNLKTMSGEFISSFVAWNMDYKTKVEFSVCSVYENSEINLIQVANQMFLKNSYLLRDRTKPEIIIDGEYNVIGTKRKGEALMLYKAYGLDVLDNNVETNLIVEFNDGEKIKTIYNGNISKNQIIKLDNYGAYTVSYNAIDSSGNKNNINYRIMVEDKIKPSIKLVEKIDSTYKIGEFISMPKVIYEDNYSTECEVDYYILDLNSYNRVKVVDKYKVQSVSDYKLIIVVKDKNYNVTSYKIAFSVIE